jgi:hypothetical protein
MLVNSLSFFRPFFIYIVYIVYSHTDFLMLFYGNVLTRTFCFLIFSIIIGFEFEMPGWSGGSHSEPFATDGSLNKFGEILGILFRELLSISCNNSMMYSWFSSNSRILISKLLRLVMLI